MPLTVHFKHKKQAKGLSQRKIHCPKKNKSPHKTTPVPNAVNSIWLVFVYIQLQYTVASALFGIGSVFTFYAEIQNIFGPL